ncbi:hypothetical protein DOTSEDRAFT_55493 [Dothistroma septosporum NZE10]|uniref:Uncharacterized protein n=1 Tax=Dothistroma septosporum (strain NZE10 / CBS 128990) TaxID=675120 RepID=N1PHC7_DOTSN|nr:hypothetical protein DOTSEDRAFT_55493 [Dothistroma septosporum NZE10]
MRFAVASEEESARQCARQTRQIAGQLEQHKRLVSDGIRPPSPHVDPPAVARSSRYGLFHSRLVCLPKRLPPLLKLFDHLLLLLTHMLYAVLPPKIAYWGREEQKRQCCHIQAPVPSLRRSPQLLVPLRHLEILLLLRRQSWLQWLRWTCGYCGRRWWCSMLCCRVGGSIADKQDAFGREQTSRRSYHGLQPQCAVMTDGRQ